MRADYRAKLRSEKSYGRKPGKKPPGLKVLIVTEDAKSSPSYFEFVRCRLRLTTASVEICGKECGSAPISVVDFAVRRSKELKKANNAPDRVFCVVDVDNHSTFDAAREKAAAHKFDYNVSCPCFERWYLLHFESGDRPHPNYDSLREQLKTYLPSYDKGTFCGFEELWERLEQAIKNAERLHLSRTGDPAQKAYTDVDKVIRFLLEMKKAQGSSG